ncbi:MAG: Mur ligase family protein [Eubacteriales bacterium]|nr:Mur ligase family protein [Eubacteriales bacterium]
MVAGAMDQLDESALRAAETYWRDSFFQMKPASLNPGQMQAELRSILEFWGDPDRELYVYHIAGSNAKGSIAAYAAACLAFSGLRVGLFTSPYVERFGERIRFYSGREAYIAAEKSPAEVEISERECIEYLARIFMAIDLLGFDRSNYSHFHYLTLIAILFFSKREAEVIVFETGLGGLWDATNVILSQKTVLIGPISYDHCQILGNTISEIAAQKAGIIRPKSRVFLYEPEDTNLSPEEAAIVNRTFLEHCRAYDLDLTRVSSRDYRRLDAGLWGQRFELAGVDAEFQTRLLGDFQAHNASLVLRAILSDPLFIARFSKRGSEWLDQLVAGIQHADLPGRIDCLGEDPMLIVDGAHNPQAVDSLLRNVSDILANRSVDLLISLNRDKAYAEIIRTIYQCKTLNIRKIYALAPASVRCFSVSELLDLLETEAVKQGRILKSAKLSENGSLREALPELGQLSSPEDIEAYFRYTREVGVASVAFGSFFCIAPIKQAYQKIHASEQREK